MPGYREFRPGQIWFYYNPNVSKELERKKELGAITSRPVVIVQNAYYPEWTDSVTVIPMTSSDRRSGIHIDTTILHDGSIIEGGTVLPYLFYTVKTRYLHAMTSEADGSKLHLVSLSDEDFEEVQEAISYHLGFTRNVPEYVKQWKSLNDYEKSAIIKQIRLVVNDFENQQRQVLRLRQEVDPSPVCENHVNACFNRVSPDRTQFLTSAGKTPTKLNQEKSEKPIKLSELTVDAAKDWKKNHPQPAILFQSVSVPSWANTIDPYMILDEGDFAASRIYPGSKVLANVPYNQIHTVLTQEELDQVSKMGNVDVIKCTGAKSSGTAYRIRKQAANAISLVDNLIPKIPDAFSYDSKLMVSPTKRHRAKQLKRYQILLGLNENETRYLLTSDVSELEKVFPQLAPSEIKQLKIDVAMMYPNRTIIVTSEDGSKSETTFKLFAEQTNLEKDATDSVDAEFNTTYELWETLAPAELSEIASASKRNSVNVAKKYGVARSNFPALRLTAIEVCKVNGKIHQPQIDENRKEIACNKIITEDLRMVSSMDILIFCRTDYNQIVTLYGKCGSPNTPSKKDIMDLKRNLRRIIVRKKK